MPICKIIQSIVAKIQDLVDVFKSVLTKLAHA